MQVNDAAYIIRLSGSDSTATTSTVSTVEIPGRVDSIRVFHRRMCITCEFLTFSCYFSYLTMMSYPQAVENSHTAEAQVSKAEAYHADSRREHHREEIRSAR